jgi:membrane-associated protein
VIHGLLDLILRLSGASALLVVFLLPFAECAFFAGFFIPGEIGVLLGGVLANQHRVSLAGVLIAGISGAIIGDSVGYEVGRRWGDAVLRKLPDRLVDDGKVDKAEDLVRRLGGKAVFVGRFTTAARVLVPGLAGTARIPYVRFLFFNATGGAIWATAFILLGYAFGSQYQRVERNANLFGLAVLGVLLVAGGLYYVRRRRRRAAGLPAGTGG